MFQNNLLMGAAAAASGGADLVSVGNSALFSTTSQELERTPSTAGNLDRWTFSAWVYFCAPTGASSKPIFGAINGSANQQRLMLTNTGAIQFDWYSSSSYAGRLITSQLLRDIGWYHIVAVYDSGNAISSQRQQLYLNGQRITAFGTEAYVSQNLDGLVNSAVMHQIGLHDGLTLSTDGYIAEAVLLDGTAAEPTSFGAYDSSGLFWTPLSSATIQELTFGTNGFYLANKVTNQPQLDFQAGDDNTLADSQIKSLLHLDGSDTSTTFTDNSSYSASWSASGNAQLDTAYKKFGTASLLLDGTGDYISSPSLGLPGTAAFTIDMWVRRNGANTNNGIFSFGVSSGGTSNQQIRLLTSTDNKLIISTNDAAVIGTGDHSTSLPDGEFAHVAVTRSGNTIYLFQNGTLLASASFSYNLIDPNPYYIGNDIGAANNFNGHVDEFRVILGECKYTSNFTVETSAYSNPPTANNWTNTGSVTTNTHTPTNLKPLLNELNSSTNTTLSNGNQSFVNSAANNIAFGTIPLPSTGKWYFEYKLNNASSASIVHVIGLMKLGDPAGWTSGLSSGFSDFSACYLAAAQQIWQDGSLLNSPSTGAGSINDILSLAVDLDNTKMWIGYNNSFYNASGGTDGNPATGANAMSTKNFSDNYGIITGLYSSQGTIQFDTDDFSYTPPTGYLALNSTNLKATTTRTASDTTKYFDTILYEGNGEQQRVGQFQPFTDSFTVAKSALFNSASSEYFSRSWGTPTNNKIFTFSTWFKLCDEDDDVTLFSSNNTSMIDIDSSNNIRFWQYSSSAFQFNLITDLEYTDNSQWANLVVMMDTTQSTAANRTKMYLNGVQITSFSTESYIAQDATPHMNNASYTHYIGQTGGSSNYWEGYLAETAFLDGQTLTASSFGSTDTSSGRWVPKSITGLTYGDRGFLLDYSNGSDLGEDQKNSNDWTNNNTVTQTTDSPTTNITVLSPNKNSVCVGTLSNGNRTVVTGSSQYGPIWTEMALSSGKWYWEGVVTADTSASLFAMFGITTGTATSTTQQLGYLPYDIGYYSATYDGGGYYINNVKVAAIGDWTLNDVMGCALDFDAMTLTFYKNNTSKAVVDLPSEGPYYPAFSDWDNSSTCTWVTRFASADWSYSAPTDHIAITQDNMTSSDQFISAFSWIKNRDATDSHLLADRVRGIYRYVHSNNTVVEETETDTFQQFLAGGIQIGSDDRLNTANESFVLWNWMMETTGSGTSNTAGTVNTTRTLVDTTLGLSISLVPVPASGDFTIGHGLGAIPKFIIVKGLEAADNWVIHARATMSDTTDYILFTTAAQVNGGSNVFGASLPTSTVLGLSAGSTSAASKDAIVYAFADSQFIATGSFEGNANNNGTFIPTVNSLGIPIQPTWMLIKNIDATGAWGIFDTTRSPINQGNKNIYPNYNNAEDTGNGFDIVTGGFKNRLSSAFSNASNTFIYMAIGTPIIDTDGRIIAGR